jgi:hypothetical protein
VSVVETRVQGEVYTHRILWSACLRQMHLAMSETKGNWYFQMTAMLLAYMTFEAFVNYVGTKLQPDLWENERREFSRSPYGGTTGKLRKLCELHSLPFPPDAEAFETVERLRELRNMLAHAKPEEFELTVEHDPAENPCLIKYKLDDYISQAQAELAIAHTKRLIDAANLGFHRDTDSELINEHALEGTLGYSIGHTSLEP